MRLDPLDYRHLIQDALRGVARRSLEIVADQGMPGDHHFYVSFRTDAAGVVMPPHLRERYPEEMTIVLKTQFQDLDVGVDAFSVGLYFGGVLHYLMIPFEALLSFADPAVNFQVDFQQPEESETEEAPGSESSGSKGEADEAASGSLQEAPADNVVSLSGFRKNQASKTAGTAPAEDGPKPPQSG